jgi:hypothetical protein
MIKGSVYTTMKGETFALTDLDVDERKLVDDALARYKTTTNWTVLRNWSVREVGDFYLRRGLTRRAITTQPVWKIAQDLAGRLMVRAGEALAPDYRDRLAELIRSDFPTQKAFCEATGLSEDLLSHVLSKRKHLAIDTLSDALERIGYRIQIVPSGEKA